MKENDKRETIDRYNTRLEKYGYSPKSLGWCKGRQSIRFEALTKIGCLEDCSILDVGCGFGDLSKFLEEKGLIVDYTGYDINPNLIRIAKEIYPRVRFDVRDIEEDLIDEKFDWVFSSGVFNFKLSDSKRFIKSMLSRMFNLCKKGVAVDFLSDYVDYRNKEAHYSSPEDIFGFCKTLSKRVLLRHDYMPYEFCVYIYKDDQIDTRNVFAKSG